MPTFFSLYFLLLISNCGLIVSNYHVYIHCFVRELSVYFFASCEVLTKYAHTHQLASAAWNSTKTGLVQREIWIRLTWLQSPGPAGWIRDSSEVVGLRFSSWLSSAFSWMDLSCWHCLYKNDCSISTPVAAQSLDSAGKEHQPISQKPQQKSHDVSLVLMGSHVWPWANQSLSLGLWDSDWPVLVTWYPLWFFFPSFPFLVEPPLQGHVSSEQGRGNDSGRGIMGFYYQKRGWMDTGMKQLNVTISSFCRSEGDRGVSGFGFNLVSDSSFFVCEVFCIGGQKSHTILTLDSL